MVPVPLAAAVDDRDPEPEPEANSSSPTITITTGSSSSSEADVVNSFVWKRDGWLVLFRFFFWTGSCFQYIGIPYRADADGYQISVGVGERTRDLV